MFLVQTDGSVVDGANSYVSVAYADTYHDDRGNTTWTGTDAVKQAALIKATDYVEQVYYGRWIGYPTQANQPLAWPRSYHDPELYYTDFDIAGTIPEKLKQAVCILALESIGGDELNPVQTQTVKREKVDIIEVEYMAGNEGGRTGSTRPAIDGLLRKLLSGSSLNARVVRV